MSSEDTRRVLGIFDNEKHEVHRSGDFVRRRVEATATRCLAHRRRAETRAKSANSPREWARVGTKEVIG